MSEARRIIQTVELADGTRFLVQARSLGGEEDVGIGDILKFETVTKVVGGVAMGLKKTFETVKPKKATVEFGLELGLESGQLTALLVEDSAKASLKITLEWGE